MKLYPHQVIDLGKIREAFRQHKRVLYVAPTGSGKTELFTNISISHVRKNPNGLVYILVHRQELMEQVEGTVVAQGERCGRISPTDLPGSDDRIVVVSVQTILRRLDVVRAPTLLVIDEAHHATASTTWGKVAAAYGRCPVLGVTATPCRLSGEGLSACFDGLVLGPTVRDLIRLGYLARPDVYCPSVPDLRGVHARAGEFISVELERILDRSTITGDAIEAYKKYANGTQFVCFGVSRAHIEKIAARFRESGIHAVAIDGTLAKEQRSDVVRDFRTGVLQGLVSCNLIDEGFNVPGIECGIDLAPTRSLGRYLQRVGRCLRTADGKTQAVILDLAGNALRHGLPQTEQNWTLEGTRNSTRRADMERPPSVRICPDCFAANASVSDACAQCGYVFPIKGRTFATQKGELQLLREAKAATLAAAKLEAEKERAIQQTTYGYKELVALGKRRRYKDPEKWAWFIHQARKNRKNKMRVRL